MKDFEILRGIIANTLDIEQERVIMEARLEEDLGADSLDIVELVTDIEDELGVEIPDEALMEMKTVKDVWDFIEKA